MFFKASAGKWTCCLILLFLCALVGSGWLQMLCSNRGLCCAFDYPGCVLPAEQSAANTHTHARTCTNLLLQSHCDPAAQLVFRLCVLTKTNGENQPVSGSVNRVESQTNGGKVTEHSRAGAWGRTGRLGGREQVLVIRSPQCQRPRRSRYPPCLLHSQSQSMS